MSSTGRIVLIVLGAISALVGLAMLGGAAGLTALQLLAEDDDGFLTSPEADLVTDTRAMTVEDLDVWVSEGPEDWTPRFGDVALRVRVEPSDQQVFVGVGPADEVDRYLDGVAHDEVIRIDGGGDDDVVTRRNTGERAPAPPGELDLWDASESGADPLTLTWSARPGEWTIVVMNADGSPGLQVAATGGLRLPFLVPITIGLFAVGLLAVAVAVALLIAGAAQPGREPAPATTPAASPAGGPYPVSITATLDPGLSRWQWLVKWLLALPHLVVLAFLWAAFAVLTFVAGVAILFTGRYPRGIFDFNVGVLRWTWRVTYYAFGVLGTDAYPPFTLQRTNHPADLDVAHPERLSRGLVLVKWWLLAIPHYLIIAVFTGGVVSWSYDPGQPEGWEVVAGGGLIGILSLVAVVALLFSGRYPQSLFDLTMGLQRWVYRVVAYVALMTDQYPPFRLDPGGQEPGTPVTPPTGPTPQPARADEDTVQTVDVRDQHEARS